MTDSAKPTQIDPDLAGIPVPGAPNQLRSALSPTQRSLLDVIFESLTQEGEWPIWQYVDLAMDQRHRLDATVVLSELPNVSGKYYLVSGLEFGHRPPDGKPIGLTVAGMQHIPAAHPLAGLYLEALRKLVERYSNLRPSPREMVDIQVRLDEVMPQPERAPHLNLPSRDALQFILRYEPPTLGCVVPGPNGMDSVRLSSALRSFRGLERDIEAYVDRVYEYYAQEPSPDTVSYVSPLTLPMTIDYLSSVWREFTATRLVGRMSVAKAAALSLDCATLEEFESRLSSLCYVLDTLQVPGNGQGPDASANRSLDRLETYLAQRLPSEGGARCRTAIRALRAIRWLRSWRQHEDPRARNAFVELGLPFPPNDWALTWNLVRGHAARALEAVLEEVQMAIALDLSGSGPALPEPPTTAHVSDSGL